MPEERCGYAYEASAMSGLGGVCCWRETWNDTSRCIWHADVGQKPTREFEAVAPEIGERLDGAIFRDVRLGNEEWLSGHTLDGAQFVNCNLEDADLSGTDLRYATFEGVEAQHVDLRDANLEHAEFDRTDLRGAKLENARLQYVVFSNVRIDERTEFGEEVVYERELEAGGDDQLDRYEAARWTYRELQNLAEDNGLAALSRRFYLLERDLRRREAWEFDHYLTALSREAWRWTTGYGSNPWRVMATSAFVIVLCAILYPVTGGIQEVVEQNGNAFTYTVEDPEVSQWQGLLTIFGKSLYFSTVTFATLGFGDIQPIGGTARMIAGIEALLGQMLMALLVFVLTRNVTWTE